MSTLKVDAIRHNSATSDAITTAADGTCTANITSNYSNRSVVYNGAMKIAQRGTNFTGVTASGTFPVDRFLFHVGSLGTWTLSQSTDVPTGQGLSHSIKCDVTTANASPSGTAYARIDQRFEGQDLQRFCKGTSSAKNFAVSFWVKSPKTGTHIVQLQDQDNSRTVSKAYTVSSANTWEKKELIFPADTTGAFGNDSGGSLFLAFYLAVGTGYQGGTLQTTWGTPVNNTRATGQVNVADSTSNNFYLTGVQMEASSYCSEFEHRSYGDELIRCMRYYEHSYNDGITPGANSNVGGWYQNQTSDAGSNAAFSIEYKVRKRAAPVTTVFYADDGTANQWDYARNGASGKATVNYHRNSQTHLNAYLNVGSSWASCYVLGHWTASSEL